MPKKLETLFLLTLMLLALSGCATRKSARQMQQEKKMALSARGDKYDLYIQQYAGVAVSQMQRHKIPASITLAQGLLESGAGQSTLTRQSNNHFGIKADKRWTGKSVPSPDNGRICRFRSYKSAAESFEDHSLFLASQPRYASLFELKITDYKGWAHGLRRTGYAEDPAYPQKLINLIEKYSLYEYDGARVAGGAASSFMHVIKKGNDLYYITARSGDTLKSLGKELKTSRRKLLRYNDLPADYTPGEGDILYLEKKNRKAPKGYNCHVLQAGESLHTVSQRYGVRLERLYKMNGWDYSHLPVLGEPIRLR